MLKEAFTLIATSFFVTGVYAAQNGLYGLGGIGMSSSHHNYIDVAGRNSRHYNDNTVISEEKNSFAAKLGLGYQFCSYGAVEGGFYWLGKTNQGVSAIEKGARTPVSSTAKISVFGLAVDLVGRYPATENLAFFGKVGVALLKTKVGSQATEAEYTFKDNKTALSPKLGVGMEYVFTENSALRFEYERFIRGSRYKSGPQGQILSPKADYDLFTLGLRVNF